MNSKERAFILHGGENEIMKAIKEFPDIFKNEMKEDEVYDFNMAYVLCQNLMEKIECYNKTQKLLKEA